MKVVQRLGELGWVDTVRGRNGGLRLFPHSTRLTVGEVVRATENDFALVGCFAEGETARACAIEPQCRLKGVLAAAREAFFAELDRHTLGEIAQPAPQLAVLLGIKPVAIVRDASSAEPSALPGLPGQGAVKARHAWVSARSEDFCDKAARMCLKAGYPSLFWC